MHLLKKDIRVGLRVKCVYSEYNSFKDKPATVVELRSHDQGYIVKWDHGCNDYTVWNYADNIPCFELYSPDDCS